MVKLKFPTIAAQASGTLNQMLTFADWKGKPYLRKRAKPNDPRTTKQIPLRLGFGFLVTQWNYLSDADKFTWDELALDAIIPNYNAYLSHNQLRWRNFTGLTKAYPAAESALESSIIAPVPVPNSLPGKAHLRLRLVEDRGNWAYLVFRSQSSGYTSSPAELVHITPFQGAGFRYWTDAPLAPGNYYYRGRAMSLDGQLFDQTIHYTTIVL